MNDLDLVAVQNLFYEGIVVILGLCLGSFTTVFASRYPKGESLWRPGSRCPSCHSPIKVYYNIPVLGWLILRGRCAQCHGRIAARYPLMELSFGLVAAAMMARFGLDPRALVYLGYMWVLLLIAWVDWETSYIYDVSTLPLLVLGIVLGFIWPGPLGVWWASLAGAVLMFALMEGSYQIVRLMTHREALGGGDVKLMAAAGAFLGPWAGLRAVVMVALLSPPYWFFVRRAKNLGPRDPFPFGPVLVAGCALSAWELLSGDLGGVLRQYGWTWLAESLLF